MLLTIFLSLLLVGALILRVPNHSLFSGVCGLLWCVLMAVLRQDTVGLLRRVFFLLFNPKELIVLNSRHTPATGHKTLEGAINQVHHNVWRAFWISVWAAIFSLSTFEIFNSFYPYELPYKLLIVSRFVAYCLILWGLFSPLGRHIDIGEEETLLKIVDEEWHRFIYMFGLVVLLLSYLFELKFKPTDPNGIDFSILITAFNYLKSSLFLSKEVIAALIGAGVLIGGYMYTSKSQIDLERFKIKSKAYANFLRNIELLLPYKEGDKLENNQIRKLNQDLSVLYIYASDSVIQQIDKIAKNEKIDRSIIQKLQLALHNDINIKNSSYLKDTDFAHFPFEKNLASQKTQ